MTNPQDELMTTLADLFEAVPRLELDPDVSIEDLGLLPTILLPSDDRPAAEQFNERYAHGGGWNPMPGWTMLEGEDVRIQYPGDEPLSPIACFRMSSGESVFIYPHAWVCIMQPNEEFEVARID